MTHDAQWSDWTSRLEGELDRDDAGGFVIRCPGPGHSPADRSLSVWIDGDSPGGFRVHSFAVRDDDFAQLRDYVRGKVGAPEWKPNGKGNGHHRGNGRTHQARPRGTLVEHYIYECVDGLPVLRVSRWRDPKSFTQSRPYGRGAWRTGGIPKATLVPFKLPEIVEAIALGRTVFVTEGEKGALSLWKHGVPASCSPMGAGKWLDHYSPWFGGADVVVLPDNDLPGQRHAEQVRASLEGVAATVRIINLPGLGPGEDAFDYLERGGDALSIASLPGPRQPRPELPHVFTAYELQRMRFRPLMVIVPEIIAEGITLIAGAPKRGKSWLACDFSAAVARGGFTLDRRCGEGDTLYCALEDGGRRLKARLSRVLGGEHDGDWTRRLTLRTQLPRMGDGGEEVLIGWIEAQPDPRLIVIDTLAYVRPTRMRDEDWYAYDTRCIVTLKRIADRYGVAIIVIHHTRKSTADDPLEMLSGTNGLTGAADSVLVLHRTGDRATLYGRGRDLEDFEFAVQFDRTTCRWSMLGDAGEVGRSGSRQAILDALRSVDWDLSPLEIALMTSQERDACRQLLLRMRKAGEVVCPKPGKYRAAPEPPSQPSQP